MISFLKLKTDKEKYNLLLPYFLLITGIVTFIFSNGRWIIPIAAWVAPVFLLRFVRSKKSFPELTMLFVLIAVASPLMLFGIIPSMPGGLFYALTTYYAVLWFFPYLADRMIANRLKGFISTLVFPIAAVSAEYINNLFYGSWASLAYTQFDDLSLIQISSVVGMWGVTFIVMWFASVANWILDNKLEWQAVRTGVLIYSFTLLFILLYGGIRLGVFPPQSNTVTIVSFTPAKENEWYLSELEKRGFRSSIKMAEEDRAAKSEILNRVYDKVFEQNNELISSDVSLTFWPEALIKVLEEDEVSFIDRGKELATEKNVYLLLAYFVIPEDDPGRSGENKSVLINPEGEVEWEYLKTYPVHGSTDKAGDGILPVSDTPFGRISTTICYDMDFTGLLNQAGKADVDIMIVPAWDWKAIDPLHARMAVFRAIENGFSMVRQTGNSLSIAVDYLGRTAAAMDHFTTEDHTMISKVPVKGVRTVYAVIGDMFAWLCITVLLLSIGWAFIKRKDA
jgi:apolipoprotein N-acyltransferase